MRTKRFSIVVLVLLFASLMVVSPIPAQDEEEQAGDGAEINAKIIDDIPSIKVSTWTDIDLLIVDKFGIDWRMLSSSVPEWWMRIFWPLNPSFPQPVERFFGPTSIKLEPEIAEGSESGWYARINPSTIEETYSGDNHTVTLQVQVDDSSVDNSVVIGIKCTRIDTLGGELGYSYIYVPVKASPTNFIKMETLEESTKETGPKTLIDFTLDIKNEGYYKDVFEFEIEEENGLMGLMNQQAVTMLPGETKRVTLEILTPEKLFDPGTPNEVKIFVRSTGNTTKTLVGTLIVVTKGMYISPLVGIIAAPVIILLILGYFFFVMYKDKQDRENRGKPPKPWTLPEEKQRLQQLKKKDAEAYQKELDKMKKEYQSSIRAWKNSQQKTSKDSFVSLSNPFSRLKKEKTEVKEPSEPSEKTEKKIKKEEKKVGKQKKDETEKEATEEKLEKPISEESTIQTQHSSKKEVKDSVSDKVVSGLKKWFTVPEEEKQKKKESVEDEKKSEPVEKKSSEEPPKESDEYERELKRIEEEQKQKRAQKAKQQKQLEKEKAMNRVKKAQQKQKKKLKK